MGQVLTLVNRVAERFPDKIIATLAYTWAADPPRHLHAADNVLIVLCHNEGCFSHALDECSLNRPFLDRLIAWKGKARQILVWDYFSNFHSYLMPTPDLRRMQRDFRTYRDLGIESMFGEGSTVHGGYCEGLRQYVLAKLLWDPERDVWALAEEWLAGTYGRVPAGHMLEYLRMLEEHVLTHDVHMPSFGHGQEIQEAIFTPEVLARGRALWDQAEAAAGDETMARRVFAARAPEMCTRLFHAGLRYEIAGDRFAPIPQPDFALRDRFVEAAIAGGAAHLREDDGAPEDFAVAYGRSYQAVVLESRSLRLTALPELGGRILSLIHRPADLELLRRKDPIRYVNYGPYDAGAEFAVDRLWHGSGTRAVFSVVSRTADAVVMEARLDGDLLLRTSYALDDDEVRIVYTVVNTGGASATVMPTTHPEWSMDVFGDDAKLRMLRDDGGWREMPLNSELRETRNLSFAGTDRPAGRWELVARSGLVLRETFSAQTVEQCVLMLSRRDGHANLELKFAPLELPPGAAADFATTWQIGH